MANLFTLPAAQSVADQVLNNANQLFQMITQFYNVNYNLVWDNPAASPPDILAAMGVNAASLFNATGELGAYLNSLGAGVPASYPTDKWTVTFNADGSATCVAVTPS